MKTYRPTMGPKMVNVVYRRLAAGGRGPTTLHSLTTHGRKSGRERRIPVHVLEMDGQRYVTAIYGEQEWVRNVRAEKRATLSRAGDEERITLVETDGEEAARVLRQYVEAIPHVRPYLPHTESGELDYAAMSTTHAVFRVAAA